MLGLNAAISLLDCFRIEKPELRLTDISTMTGYSKANVLRYLTALKDAGLIKRNEDTKKYSLGYKIILLSEVAKSFVSFKEVAFPYIKELRDFLNETVSMHVIQENHVICIERQISSHELKHMPKMWVEKPLYIGSGRVILAYMGEDRIKEIIEQGSENIARKGLKNLLIELEETRKQGYLVRMSSQQIKSIIAPIWNNGTVIAALRVSGPVLRITEEKEPIIINELKRTAANISGKL